MSTLHRTQVYIEEDQMRQLKIEAERESLAVSELIRKAIRRLLDAKAKTINWNSDPLTRAIGKINLTENDVSVNHNHYLYGGKG